MQYPGILVLYPSCWLQDRPQYFGKKGRYLGTMTVFLDRAVDVCPTLERQLDELRLMKGARMRHAMHCPVRFDKSPLVASLEALVAGPGSTILYA